MSEATRAADSRWLATRVHGGLMSDVARANGDHTAGHVALRGEATQGAKAAQSAQ